MVFGFVAASAVASDADKIVGPNACAECHKQEVEAWKGSHHFKTYREMPRNTKANEIAEKMGVRRIRTESLCATCHYTVEQKGNQKKPIAGISCESCHGGGKDWIKVHSEFSGKTILFESKAEAAARWKLSESKGMLRPRSFYLLAKNCYGCHVVPQEDLVNKGGHPAGSAFELVSWSQGEVRHSTWHSKGRDNVPASAARKRMLYLVGLGVELETGIRAIGRAKSRNLYAFEMAKRVDRARKQLAAAAKAAPNVPEIAKLVAYSYSAGLKLNNERTLTAAADGISKQLVLITEKYDGSTMSGLDGLVPGPEKYKGKVRKPDN
ncbi:cytochrome c family protein [Hyphomicrobium sp.]|uniref:cytochrome c family protein n=1 Tax=Hyphomicrobium sp. TaxID=82 RepID=UPI0025BACFCE|nr:cytochrome c family protein [Hyphomicrobium sp.]MCC7252601.1 cytochrome c family protein [Hyphomicrobium sp.]